MTRGLSTLLFGSLGFRIFGGGLRLAFCKERTVIQKRGSTGLKFGYPNNDKPFQKSQQIDSQHSYMIYAQVTYF
jgi:hypothetical protein